MMIRHVLVMMIILKYIFVKSIYALVGFIIYIVTYVIINFKCSLNFTCTHGLDQMIQDPESVYNRGSTDFSHYESDGDFSLAQ
jgi:hypothetical protein